MGNKVVADNRKAQFNYFLEERYEAGIVLSGTEVKSVRCCKVNFCDSFVTIRDGEAFVHNLDIPAYSHAGTSNHQPKSARKLLLHKSEIDRLQGKCNERGYSIIPTQIYFKRHLVKVEIALARGKKMYDKRQVIKGKEANREIQRMIKDHNRG